MGYVVRFSVTAFVLNSDLYSNLIYTGAKVFLSTWLLKTACMQIDFRGCQKFPRTSKATRQGDRKCGLKNLITFSPFTVKHSIYHIREYYQYRINTLQLELLISLLLTLLITLIFQQLIKKHFIQHILFLHYWQKVWSLGKSEKCYILCWEV